jgi:uncharacterized membrane protein YbaN (DUF454 family)
LKRPLYLSLGVTSLMLGVIGAFLPVLPTVPFVLLAAWCFGKAHPAWEARLLSHPTYGPPIRAWREHGAIPLRAKQIATLMMTCSGVLTALTLPGWWRVAPSAAMLLVCAWMWTRPSR